MKALTWLAITCASLPIAASACGVCIEDKVAATYDHAVITRAVADRHVVVFAAIEGSADAGSLAADAQRAARGLRGVDRASVRSAADPVALSFAIDPKLHTPEQAIAAIEKRSGLKLTLLRIVR